MCHLRAEGCAAPLAKLLSVFEQDGGHGDPTLIFLHCLSMK